MGLGQGGVFCIRDCYFLYLIVLISISVENGSNGSGSTKQIQKIHIVSFLHIIIIMIDTQVNMI